MRRKNDILIKYFQLANTMFLSHEALGLLVRRIIIEDDVNGLRYENLDEDTANELRRVEQRWETEYQTLRKNNPMVIQAKSSLSVQVNKSTKAFEALRQRLNNKNLDDSIDDPDPEMLPSVKCPVGSDGTPERFNIDISGEEFSFTSTKESNSANFPTKSDMETYLKYLNYNDEQKQSIVEYIIHFGTEQDWQVHWMTIAKEAEATVEQ